MSSRLSPQTIELLSAAARADYEARDVYSTTTCTWFCAFKFGTRCCVVTCYDEAFLMRMGSNQYEARTTTEAVACLHAIKRGESDWWVR